MRHELVRGRVAHDARPDSSMASTRVIWTRLSSSMYVPIGLVKWSRGEPGVQADRGPGHGSSPGRGVRQRGAPRRPGARARLLPGCSDLAVEVISPHDLYTEVAEKVDEWLEHGTRMVVVTDPRRQTVAVHRPGQLVRILGMDDVLDGEDVVPGWRLVRDDSHRSRTRSPPRRTAGAWPWPIC